ncbi:MAG: ABC transporter permease [Planctomycetota bacterium]
MQTFTDLYKHRFILENLVSKNLKVLYRNMALGVVWSVVNPLVMVSVLTAVWVVFFGQELSFALSVLVALVPYNLFVYCLSGCTSVIRDNAPLVKKVSFPRQILPVSVVLTHVVQFPIPLSLVVIGLLVIPKDHPTVTMNLLWLIPIFVLQLGLSFGVGFLVAALNAKYRDVQYIVESVLVVLFWLCPILYEASAKLNAEIAAGSFGEWAWYAYFLNPLAGILEGYRSVLYLGRPPEMAVMLMALIMTLLIGVLGVRKFWVHEREFADLI